MKPTKKFENFLYWSVAANSMGSWFTLIGLALLVQEKHGGTALAFVWILQSLPMIAFSRKVAERFNVFNLIPLWCSLQIIAAINVFILSFSQSLSSIFIYIFLSTTISCISNSVSRAMISTYVDQEKTPEVFRRSGALSSSLIAVSPIIGAYISNLFGMKYLFIIDAISFIIAAAIIFNFRPSVVNSIPSNSHQKINFNLVGVLAEACRSFADTLTLNSKLKSAPSLMFRQISRHWFYFLIAGAFLNGLEFPLFDHYELSRMQIGYALGAWGVGNFIVLFLPSRIESMLSVSQLTFFFASFLGVVFLVPNPWSVIFSMGIAAFFYSILAGRIKGQINTEMPSDMSPLEVWAYFGQRTGMINIIFYLLCAALLLLNIDIARGIFCAFLGIYTFETFRKSVPIQKTEITNGNEFNV